MLQTDEGLADFMIEHNIDDGLDVCKDRQECNTLLDSCRGTIPAEWCRQCLIDWLRKERET